MAPAAVLVVLAELAAASGGRFDLATAARASPRPAECTLHAGLVRAGSSWTRIRRPGFAAFCDRLAHGYSVLNRDAAAALTDAEAAGALVKGRAEPLVLAARALAGLEKASESYRMFERAQRLDPRSIESPGALHDFARVALLAGQPDAALTLYRTLVPRVPLLGDVRRRQRAYVEAAVLAMSRDRANLNEAIGYLTEARRQEGAPEVSDFVLAALALALDRQGRREEASGVTSDAPGPWRLDALAEAADSGKGRKTPVVLPDGEMHALVAILADGRDPDIARTRWQAYVEARPDGPYADRSKEHLARLGGRQ